MELIDDKHMIKKATVAQSSENENWKLNLIQEVSLVKKGFLEANFDEVLLEEILEFACTDYTFSFIHFLMDEPYTSSFSS